jgi:Sir2 family protein
MPWLAPVFASRKYPQAHRIWRPAITSTVRGPCRQARFTWEMACQAVAWRRLVGHQGIAPCIPVWKTGVFLSTLMPGEMELIVVVGSFKRRNNPHMIIPAELLQRLAAAKSVTVLTGAGVSAESGVPTFRDAQTGLWAKFSPEELATPRAFQRNPRLVWEWYDWRRKLVACAKPNPAHLALVEMQNLFLRFHLITQNVDGLHQRTGSRNVIKLYGNITRTKCSEEGTIISTWKDTGDVPPKCPACGGLLRPRRGLV